MRNIWHDTSLALDECGADMAQRVEQDYGPGDLQPWSEDEADAVVKTLLTAQAMLEAVCEHYGVDDIAELTSRQVHEFVARLQDDVRERNLEDENEEDE